MPLVPLDLTYVQYAEGDRIAKLCALLSLSPPLILASLATLLVSRRDLGTAAFTAGLLLTTALSSALKPVLAQPRPTGYGLDHTVGFEHGMPSSHSVFVFFCAAYIALWSLGGRWQEPVLLFRAGLAAASLGFAFSVAAARVHLHYHTPAQVAAGAALGALCGAAWQQLTERALRPHFAAVADSPLCQWLLVRDCSSVHVNRVEYEAVRRGASAQKRA